jgi:hypothetical protein
VEVMNIRKNNRTMRACSKAFGFRAFKASEQQPDYFVWRGNHRLGSALS